ncbi:hypothetical protein KA036_02575 [Candidatus Gracilibacteria bacterium]|jgi:hypothetical protein|nr:hypothetical protein [Candidatus Gracilibacteria bacterium]
MARYSKSFRKMLAWHVLVIAVTSIVFFWVFPIISILFPIVATAAAYYWYKQLSN